MELLLIVLALVAGALVALRRIAPLTKTKVDDKAVVVLEKAQDVGEKLLKK